MSNDADSIICFGTVNAPDYKSDINELQLLVASRTPILFIETGEEARAEQLVYETGTAQRRRVFTWSLTQGLIPWGDVGVNEPTRTAQGVVAHILRGQMEAIVILRDFCSHLEDPEVLRMVRDIVKSPRTSIVVLDANVTVPEPLVPFASVYHLPPPDQMIIASHVREAFRQFEARGIKTTLDETGISRLTSSLRGLTMHQIDQVLSRLAFTGSIIDEQDILDANVTRSKMIASDGVVEIETPEQGLEWVSGFIEFKTWIAERSKAFQPGATEFGITPPRGFLLTGVPGCGKSLVIKAVAHDLHLPLLRLDAGSLFDKFIGESEKNLRSAFLISETLAPCILWIDEIEKGFGSTGPSESDGGLGFRMIGMLATWMQERKAPVIIAATSNDITKLPPELTRQGRFDEIFFVDLPETTSRSHLFMIQLALRKRDYKQFDGNALSVASEGFSGAEIEQAVTNDLYSAFAANREITTGDILGEIEQTRPLSEMQPDRIEKIRNWGRKHARSV